MRFIFEPRGDATTMHIESHNALGESLGRPICRALLRNARTVNIPLGCLVCPDCMRMVKHAALSEDQP